jgi:hypothetical protein
MKIFSCLEMELESSGFVFAHKDFDSVQLCWNSLLVIDSGIGLALAAVGMQISGQFIFAQEGSACLRLPFLHPSGLFA